MFSIEPHITIFITPLGNDDLRERPGAAEEGKGALKRARTSYPSLVLIAFSGPFSPSILLAHGWERRIQGKVFGPLEGHFIKCDNSPIEKSEGSPWRKKCKRNDYDHADDQINLKGAA